MGQGMFGSETRLPARGQMKSAAPSGRQAGVRRQLRTCRCGRASSLSSMPRPGASVRCVGQVQVAVTDLHRAGEDIGAGAILKIYRMHLA